MALAMQHTWGGQPFHLRSDWPPRPPSTARTPPCLDIACCGKVVGCVALAESRLWNISAVLDAVPVQTDLTAVGLKKYVMEVERGPPAKTSQAQRPDIPSGAELSVGTAIEVYANKHTEATCLPDRFQSKIYICLALKRRPRLWNTSHVAIFSVLWYSLPSYYPVPSRQRFRGVPLLTPRT